MKVDTSFKNPALLNLFENPNQIIAADANFFIPPDRRSIGARHCFELKQFCDIWIIPIINCFPKLAIHEAVQAEFVEQKLAKFISDLINCCPPKLILLKDFELNPNERIIRDSKEIEIAKHTAYEPSINNKDDRGEVKTLAHISTKGYLYFASNDKNALELVDCAQKLKTTLDEQVTIKFYEGVFYLYRTNSEVNKNLKILYKYLYRLTNMEKGCNPTWDEFIAAMEKLYA